MVCHDEPDLIGDAKYTIPSISFALLICGIMVYRRSNSSRLSLSTLSAEEIKKYLFSKIGSKN